jgi:hypothetical protein
VLCNPAVASAVAESGRVLAALGDGELLTARATAAAAAAPPSSAISQRSPAVRCAARCGALGLDALPARAALALLPAAHGWEASTAGALAGAAMWALGRSALRCNAPPDSASNESRTSAAPMRRSASHPANPVDA